MAEERFDFDDETQARLDALKASLAPVSKLEVIRRAIAMLHAAQARDAPAPLRLFCPKCGSGNVARERRPNGDDHCGACGHVWPSR